MVKPLLSKSCKHEQREPVASADPVDQAPRGGNRHPFRTHDRQVVALAQLHLAEQLVETFLFAEQQCSVAAARTRRLDTRHRCRGLKPIRVPEAAQVAFHLERAERDGAIGVRFDQVAACVEDDFPAGRECGVLRDEVRQQRLGEISIIERLAGSILDLAARRVHHLSGLRRQSVTCRANATHSQIRHDEVRE